MKGFNFYFFVYLFILTIDTSWRCLLEWFLIHLDVRKMSTIHMAIKGKASI